MASLRKVSSRCHGPGYYLHLRRLAGHPICEKCYIFSESQYGPFALVYFSTADTRRFRALQNGWRSLDVEKLDHSTTAAVPPTKI